jgi:voltage-gated potassium channel
MSPLKRLIWGIIALAVIIVTGTVGYLLIEGWSFLDSLFMTITTITTVGYDEVHPLSDGGRIFTSLLIVGGVGGALYTLTAIVAYVVEGEFGTTIGRRQMKNKIGKLKEHFIICGYGRVGQEIANVFIEEQVPFVVIDNNHDKIVQADEGNRLYLFADATNDEVLKEAGIESARGLVVAVDGDAESTYITLSARQLNPDLFIEARSSSNEAETKLKKAGANRIISPNSIGARRMAMLALRPSVVDFIDTVIYRRGRELQMENISVQEGSSLAGLDVEKARRHTKATILAINRKSGELVANPSAEEKLAVGDILIAMGTSQQLTSLEKVCQRCKSDEKI